MNITEYINDHIALRAIETAFYEAQARYVKEYGGKTNPDDDYDETNDPFALVNEPEIDKALDEAGNSLLEVVGYLMGDPSLMYDISDLMKDMHAVPDSPDHLVRLIALYAVLLKVREEML